jgi:MFS family permease
MFPRSFWMGCVMEMWERLAWYGMRVVVPIYIMQADEPGGLHLTAAQKGTIYAFWALVQSLLPMVTGGFADRYGYKRMIALSAGINSTAYVLMGTLRSYWGFFGACLLLAFGTSLFKPGLQGTLAQSMDKKSSSLGWGLFYWLVNVGAFIGPPFAGFMRGHGWPFVFYGSAAIMALNLPTLLTYPKVESGADLSRGPLTVAKDTIVNIFDARLLAIIVLFSGFWLMLYQLWDFMPNFYADWIDSSALVAHASWLPKSWLQTTARGLQLKQENALNLNAAMIVLFVVPVSWLVRRLRVLTCIAIGFFVATVGTVVYGLSTSIWMLFAGIVCFSIGEMLSGPKKSEYFALIAPKGKKALYLGYVNIPIAIGQAVGAKLVAFVYGRGGEKAVLALRYLAEKTTYVEGKGAWDGDVDHLEAFVGVNRPEAAGVLATHLGKSAQETTDLLWTTYHPYTVWWLLGAIGFASLIGVLVFARMSRRWKDMDV